MKKILFLVATAIILGFASCSEDECDHDFVSTPVASLDVVGNWYDEAENEEIRFNENGTFYDKFCNTTRSAETEGRWEYDKENSKLTYTYSFLGQSKFANWIVKNLKEMSFTISSTTVADHKLERIVETYQLEVGGSVEIRFSEMYPSYTVRSYASNNSRLASVSADGEIVATGEKGTTYIKVETNEGDVWVKVVVGDDCLDLWYDYVSLMKTDYSTVRNILGIPSVSGSDGYSFGFGISVLNDVAKEIDVFLDPSTGLVNEMALALKSSVPESQILSYLSTHYYPCTELGSRYYTTRAQVEKSAAVIWYDREDHCIRFLASEKYMWPDYADTFGLTIEDIVSRFGEFYGGLPFYGLENIYVESVYFKMDSTTDKVTAFLLGVRSGFDSSVIHAILSSKYNYYKADETNTMFAYRDGDTDETSSIRIIYNTESGIVYYYDLENM